MLRWLQGKESAGVPDLSSLFVTVTDSEKALSIVHPSAKREGFATVPDVTWDDIGALSEVREELQWSILVRVFRLVLWLAAGSGITFLLLCISLKNQNFLSSRISVAVGVGALVFLARQL